MARIVASNVRETTTTTGTGAVTLAGVRAPGRTFSSVMANNDTCFYGIFHTGANEWEIGLGTYSSGGNTITRTTVLESSNSNNAVNFSAGTKNIDLVSPALEAGGPEMRLWNNVNPEVSSNIQFTNSNSMWVFPLPYGAPFPGKMTVNTMKLGLICNNTTTSGNGSSSFASTIRFGLYTLANSTQLSLFASCSSTFTRVASSNNSSLVHGARWLTVHSSQWNVLPTLTQGRYFMGVILQTGNFNAAVSYQVAMVGRSQSVLGEFMVGQTGTSATGTYMPFHGAMQTAAIPNSLGTADVSANNLAGHAMPAIVFENGI